MDYGVHNSFYFDSQVLHAHHVWSSLWSPVNLSPCECPSGLGFPSHQLSAEAIMVTELEWWSCEPLTFFCCVCRDQVLLFLEFVNCWRWQWNYDNRCGWPFPFWIWWRPVADDLERCSGMILEALWLLLVSQEWCVWNECWVVEIVNIWRIRRGASRTMDRPIEG